MSNPRRLAAISFALVTVATALVCSSEGVVPGRQRVLVLRNGQVLTGQITHAGDRYIVAADRTSELRISTDEVEMCCLDLEEAYVRKRHGLPLHRAAAHLDLAEWCLRHSLLSHAADELLEAVALEPKHPRLSLLESRLQLAVAQPPRCLHNDRPRRNVVDLNELEHTMQSLHEDAVKRFTEHVQPLLLNRCGATSCHGSGTKTDFRLVRPTWGRTVPRRFTQRNLHAALQWVDRQQPRESKLVVVPSSSHGGIRTPLLDENDDDQIQLLVHWAEEVARQERATSPSTIETRGSNLLQASFQQPVYLPPTEPEPHAEVAGATRATGTATAQPADSTTGRYLPRDPFDPEIFNRRYSASESDARYGDTR